MKYAIAIDIGGTNTRVALVDEKLNVVDIEPEAHAASAKPDEHHR